MSRKQIAKDTLALLDRGTYDGPDGLVDFREAQSAATQGTRLYTPDQVATLLATPLSGTPSVELWDATTQRAAHRLAADGPVFLLNFASARNPGGGFLNGARAQEEDLCACSGLYPTLLTQPAYYDANRAQDSLLYTDHAILSPDVPFFKLRGPGDRLARVFLATVLTAPAPNSGPYLRRTPDGHEALEAAFLRRWRMVLSIAADADASTLLLGAWGCGAFGGDPNMAARTAQTAIQAGTSAERIVFAIPRMGKRSTHNLERFADVLGLETSSLPG